MIGRKVFFDRIRPAPFGGSLTVLQVSGCETLISEYEKRHLSDLRWLAYILATSYHETAFTMQPIHERGPVAYFDKYDAGTKKGAELGNVVKGDGYRFRGRGFVQITGRSNYSKMSDIVGHNLITDPELAIKPGIAAAITFEGMIRGSFTGKRLANYFTDTTSDWVNARRIVNALDKAEAIAGYAKQFYTALTASTLPDPKPAASPVVAKAPTPGPASASKPQEKGFWGKFADLFRPKGTG